MHSLQEQAAAQQIYAPFLALLNSQIQYHTFKKYYDQAVVKAALIDPNSPHLAGLRTLVAEVEQEFADAIADYVGPYLASKTVKHAPGFQSGPTIPYVLYLPKAALTQKVPLIIHTHGGPHVAFTLETLHAEISYFVKQGYAVVCPNYRGSKLSEQQIQTSAECITDEVAQWADCDPKLLTAMASDDVYAVALHARQLPFIDNSRVLLRGGSFGSHVNAHLLRGCQPPSNRYQNIFCGAHLSGGMCYPSAQSLPIDMPLLVTHGTEDDTSPCNDVILFMESLLLAQIYRVAHAELSGQNIPINTRTVCLVVGDHHLVPRADIIENDPQTATQLLLRKITLELGFVDSVFADNYKAPDATVQLISLGENTSRSVNDMQELARTFNYSQSLPRGTSTPSERTSPVPLAMSNKLCPTMAQLKLILGDKFTGNVTNDLHVFFQHYFHPYNFDESNTSRFDDAGEQILTNPELEKQLVAMVLHEQEFLANHPEYIVLYHAGTVDVLFAYAVITIWKAILRDELQQMWNDLPSMRFNDFIAKSFETISTFLKRMQKNRGAGTVLNYVPGYPERMLACNPSLISNRHSSGSCTLQWYTATKKVSRIDFTKVVAELLAEINLDQPQRIARYVDLFEAELAALQRDNATQSVIQQIFVPRTKALEQAVICQVWGEPFEDNAINLASINTLAMMNDDPIAFEQLLLQHRQVFTNPANLPDFGADNPDFHYSNMLEVRMRTSLLQDAVVRTYVRDHERHQRCLHDLEQIVREDFSAFLRGDTLVANAQVATAEERLLNHRARLGFHNKPHYKETILLQQQVQLRKKLVDNPSKSMFGIILEGVSRATKTRLQIQLGNLREIHEEIYLFSLCKYLKGYTYHELLQEAIVYAKEQAHDNSALQKIEQFEAFIETFSVPFSMFNAVLDENQYTTMENIFRKIIGDYENQCEIHDFFQPSDCTYTSKYLFHHELCTAMEIVLRYALIAKQRCNSDDVEQKIQVLL